MSFFIRSCIIIVLSVNEIISRSIESNTVPTIIDITNQSNATIGKLFDATEPSPRQFDVCEYFDHHQESDGLRLRDRGITVVMKLF